MNENENVYELVIIEIEFKAPFIEQCLLQFRSL